MTDAKVEGQLLGSLRLHEPHEVRAYFGESDEDFRKLAVPHAKVRKRWSRVLAAVEAKAWTRCELLDKSGAVLAYVANTAAAAELEDIPQAKGSMAIGDAERILNLVLRGQKESLAFRDAEVKELLKAIPMVLKEQANAMHTLAELYREQVDVASESAATHAEAEAVAKAAAESGWSMQQLIEAIPVIVQVLPLLKNMLGSGTPAPMPNGHAKG